MHRVAISSTGLFVPPEVITNEELVAAFNQYAQLENAKYAAEIAAGTRTALTDSNGETLCFTSDFTVSDGSSSTATYWSAQDTEGAKLSEGIQQIETTLTDAAETTMGWLTSLFG